MRQLQESYRGEKSKPTEGDQGLINELALDLVPSVLLVEITESTSMVVSDHAAELFFNSRIAIEGGRQVLIAHVVQRSALEARLPRVVVARNHEVMEI